MSTFGNNLIERLRTRLVDVRPQDQLGERSIALAKKFEYRRTRKRGERGFLQKFLPQQHRPILVDNGPLYRAVGKGDLRDDLTFA